MGTGRLAAMLYQALQGAPAPTSTRVPTTIAAIPKKMSGRMTQHGAGKSLALRIDIMAASPDTACVADARFRFALLYHAPAIGKWATHDTRAGTATEPEAQARSPFRPA